MWPNAPTLCFRLLMILSLSVFLRWYHGKLDRTIAEERLRQARNPGSYLIRESDRRPGSFVLSFLSMTNVVNHFRYDGEHATSTVNLMLMLGPVWICSRCRKKCLSVATFRWSCAKLVSTFFTLTDLTWLRQCWQSFCPVNFLLYPLPLRFNKNDPKQLEGPQTPSCVYQTKYRG